MDLKGIWRKGVNWVNLAQDRKTMWDFVNMGMDFYVP